ncbi:MAG: DJ-1/PfpI family protein [Bacteroidetes bacterium]|nr:DJ-1/PfpI family protein [Bacteroidota bacterium]
MKLAYIIFDGITWLDMIGIYDPVSRLKSMQYIPDLSWDICSFANTAKDNFGLEMNATKIREPLDKYDAVIIPGGHGTRTLQFDDPFLQWIKTAENVTYKISICTGSLILGAAGFLKNKKATTNFLEYETLKQYCREVSSEKIVEDGNIITAGAVSSSINLGLYLCNKWGGELAAKEIKRRIDFFG